MIPAPFKIYANFECLLKNVDDIGINNEGNHSLLNIKIIFLVVFLIN